MYCRALTVFALTLVGKENEGNAITSEFRDVGQ